VFMTLKPGQMSLNHTQLIHRSGRSLSNDRRIGCGISHIQTSATCRASVRQSAALPRGVYRYGHFDDEPRPPVDHGDRESAAHAEAVTRFRAQNAERSAQYEAAQ